MNPKSYSGQRCKITARPPARVTQNSDVGDATHKVALLQQAAI